MSAKYTGLSGRQVEAVALVAQDKLTNAAIAKKVGVCIDTLKHWKYSTNFKLAVADELQRIRDHCLEIGVSDLKNRVLDYQMIRDKLVTLIDTRAVHHQEQAEEARKAIAKLSVSVAKLEVQDDALRAEVEEYRKSHNQEDLKNDEEYKDLQSRFHKLQSQIHTERKELDTAINCPSFHPGMQLGILTNQLRYVGKGTEGEYIQVYETDTATLSELRAVEQQAARDLGQWTDRIDINKLNDAVIIRILNAEAARNGTVPELTDSGTTEITIT